MGSIQKLALALAFGIPAVALAQVDSSSSSVPPVSSFFDVFTEIDYLVPAVQVNGLHLSNFDHSAALDVSLSHQTEHFTGNADMQLTGGGNTYAVHSFFDVFCDFRYQGSNGGTDYFDTEMLQMNLQGGNMPGAVMIRESPTKQSLGKTSISVQPGGEFRINSFFDVFTELSIDGGQSWTPSSGSNTMSLRGAVPEPASMAVLGMAGAALLRRRNRRTR